MFPYRLRQSLLPIRKRAKRNPKHSENNAKDIAPILASLPRTGGGPLQHVIEQDLLQLREDVVTLWKKHSQASQQQDGLTATHSHHRPGMAFQVFQQVFGSAKVALLHTRFVPPRCDRGAYSQLIYVSCLSLLQQAFHSSKNDSNVDNVHLLEHATFSLFCLYAFYETNPLPRGVGSTARNNDYDASHLDMLPVGMQSLVENAKLLWRRSFRGPIRIDRNHYSMLLQLYEESKARMAQCQTQRMQAVASNILPTRDDETTLPVEPTKTTIPWTCNCALATDTIQIMDRLMPHLKLCDYTGPCSLEGLAGHAKYPYQGTTTRTRPKPELDANQQIIAKEEIENAGTDESIASVPESLMSSLQQYQTSLQSIRLPTHALPPQPSAPASQRAAHRKVVKLQESLSPIFATSSDRGGDKHKSWKTLLDVLSGNEVNNRANSVSHRTSPLRRRHVTWATEQVYHQGDDVASGISTGKFSAPQAKATPKGFVEQDMAYDVVLPSDLPLSMQQGIQKALEGLLERDQPIFLPTTTAEEHDGVHQLQDTDQQGLLMDDVSSIGIGGVSVAQSSTISGVGAVQLRNLLAKAAAVQDDDESPSAATQEERKQPAQKPHDDFLNLDSDFFEMHRQGRGKGYCLVVDDNDDANGVGDDASDTSNLSSSSVSSEDEELSQGTSAVGKRALEALLSAVTTGPTALAASTSTGKKPKARSIARSNPHASPSTAKGNGDDVSLASSATGRGKAAQWTLLSEVEATEDNSGEKPKRQRKKIPCSGTASEGEGQRKSKRSRTAHDSSDVPPTGSEEASATSEATGHGRAALAVLLSKVGQSRKNKTNSPSPQRETRSRKTAKLVSREEAEPEEASVVSEATGPGRAALAVLLSKVGTQSPNGTAKSPPVLRETRSTSRKRTGPKAGGECELDNPPDVEEEMSHASSRTGQGNAALNTLMSQVAKTTTRNGKIRSKRR